MRTSASTAAIRFILGAVSPWLASGALATVDAEDYRPKARAESGYVTILATESFEIVTNPGKGWVSYSRLSRDKAPATADHRAVVATGYARYMWSDLQPDSETDYDWSAIDADLRHCRAQGLRFAFGVMSENSFAKKEYVTPKWVFDAGARALLVDTVGLYGARGGRHQVPVWNDPVYLRKLENFVQALSRRYDGHPDLAFIDIRSYGNYGENHMDGLGTGSEQSQYITADELTQYLQIFRRHFRTTQLVFCVSGFHFREYRPVWSKAVEWGITLRLDAVPSARDELFEPLKEAIGKLPTVFEFPDAYAKMEQYFNYRELADRVELAKPSYVSLGHSVADGNRFVAERKTYVEYLANRIGFHFVLQSTLVPSSVQSGVPVEVVFNFANKGVAPLFGSPKMAVVLIDRSGRRLRTCWLDDVKVQQILPGTSNAVRARVTLDDVPDGEYQLALGIFEDKSRPEPTYRFGNEKQTPDRWLIVAERIAKAGNHFTFSGLKPGEIAITLDGRPLASAPLPQLINNCVLAPHRELVEALGAVAKWNRKTNTVTASRVKQTVSLTIGSKSGTVDGQNVALEQEPLLRAGTVFVPVHFLCESLGARVSWDQSTGTVSITTRSSQRPIPPTPPRPKADPGFRASSEWDYGYGVRSANFAFDSDPSTGWSASGNAPQWVERDFAAPTTFSRVFLKEFKHARIREFALQYYSDGAYRNACTGTSIGLDGKTVSFSPVTGTRIRLYIHTTSEGKWPLVDEVTVLDAR